ncbi:hypothetical protein SMKI_02G2970 [Saccharomyces mikatae IFO 1815]|uniref:GDT1 family protein n=1 Tax=Saccharomyces mikatae IFO 1815 TaxID=226126 RepID=A0AA35IWF1_SACMI|nr:uncharacterized protein SMKI_02G2970 [Saccharomyces mikatae IFO 1815]CAI4037422.1 hypothetical protein SMKI_02G2970 [Saccharomyces mikatae IFO 1815]
MAHQTEKTILLALLLMVVPVAASVADAEQSTNMGERVDFKDFLMSISMIGLSEIGDKTFLIAALMAMRHPRLLVFSAAATSLAIMTIISGVVGHSIVSFLSERYTAFLAGILFLVFGYKLAMEGLEMSKDAGVEEEMAEVEEEIAVSDINKSMGDIEKGDEAGHEKKLNNTSGGKPIVHRLRELAFYLFSPVWFQIFMMIFLGELGDRSQISIIAMATDKDYWIVIAGAVVGHAICSGLAVIGGKLLAARVSIRTITLASSLLFFIFALIYIYQAFTTQD